MLANWFALPKVLLRRKVLNKHYCLNIIPLVVSRPLRFYHGCAMTRILLRQASDVSTSSRPSTQPHNNGFPIAISSLFELQPTSGFALPSVPEWDSGTFLGFCPFQRHHHRTSQTRSTSRRSPLTGFVHLIAGPSLIMTGELVPSHRHS